MASVSDWKVPSSVQPKPEDYAYDLDLALACVVALRATVPADAFTAETLGTERAGNGVIIRSNGLVLTIGYLITEADTIWLTLNDGRSVPGHVLAYDQETGFGLVQALGQARHAGARHSAIRRTSVGERVVVAGAGGRHHSVAARIVAKQEFAGYWEYVLDEAIFTAPAHPNWGGTALIGPAGDLLGIGSLQLQQAVDKGAAQNINMIVPIDLLTPILDDLLNSAGATGRRGPGSGSMRPKSRTGSSSSVSPIADRPSAPTCGRATSCSRSPAPRSTTWRACSAASGRRARPASTCRSPSIATARPWTCESSPASAIASSRGRACISDFCFDARRCERRSVLDGKPTSAFALRTPAFDARRTLLVKTTRSSSWRHLPAFSTHLTNLSSMSS